MTRTEEIQKFVEENSSNTGDLLRDVWDALNVCMERLEWAKKQNEIDTTPDWSNAPDWANWRAHDKNGKWYYFEYRPVEFRNSWIAHGDGLVLRIDLEAHDWKTSLQERPQNP